MIPNIARDILRPEISQKPQEQGAGEPGLGASLTSGGPEAPEEG